MFLAASQPVMGKPAQEVAGTYLRPRGTRRLPHVRALDGVRGLASVLVLAHHLLFTSLPGKQWPLWFRAVTFIPKFSFLGVDLFFVLSGYLITSLLLLARRSPDYYHNFYWKRVFRILPALMLVLAIAWITGRILLPEMVLALLFLANLPTLWGKAEGGPFWSLSIEEQFYLLWPTLVHRERPRTLGRILILLIVVPAGLRVLSVLLGHGRTHYTFVHCDGLAWGALLALLAFRWRVPFRRWNDLGLWRRIGPLTLVLGLTGLALCIVLSHRTGRDFGMLLTAANPLFTALIAYLLTHRGGHCARFLASGPLRFLGDISYMLYLCHTYIMDYYDRFFSDPKVDPTPGIILLRFAVVLAVSLLFSGASMYLFERPIGGLRRFVLRRA